MNPNAHWLAHKLSAHVCTVPKRLCYSFLPTQILQETIGGEKQREEDYEKAHQGERSCLLPLQHAVGRAVLGERGSSASEGGEGCVAPKEPDPDTRLKAYALGGGPGKGRIVAE